MTGKAGESIGNGGTIDAIGGQQQLSDSLATSRGCNTNFIGFGRGLTFADPSPVDFTESDDAVVCSGDGVEYAPQYENGQLMWQGSAPTGFVGFAATGARIPLGTINPTQSGGTRYVQASRGLIEIMADCEYLEFHFDNVYYQSSGKTVHAFNREITHFAIEKQNASLTVPVTFAGAAGVVIPSNGHAVSDKLYPAAFGLSKFTKGEFYWMRDREVAVVGGVFIPGGYSAKLSTAVVASGVFAEYFDAANESGVNIYGTGTLPTQTGRATMSGGASGPQAIVGKFINAGELSVFAVGDSIDSGTGDKTSLVPQITGTGHFDRAMCVAPSASVIPFLNWAVPGSSTPNVIADATICQYMQYANVLFAGHVANDIGVSADGADMPTIYANKEALFAYAKAQGIKRIVCRGTFPVTTSAGGQWVSAVDQTTRTDFAAGGFSDQLDAKMADWKTAGVIDDFVLLRAVVGDPAEPYKWNSNGTNKWATIDGLHPSDVAGHPVAAASGLVRAAILAQQPFV